MNTPAWVPRLAILWCVTLLAACGETAGDEPTDPEDEEAVYTLIPYKVEREQNDQVSISYALRNDTDQPVAVGCEGCTGIPLRMTVDEPADAVYDGSLFLGQGDIPPKSTLCGIGTYDSEWRPVAGAFEVVANIPTTAAITGIEVSDSRFALLSVDMLQPDICAASHPFIDPSSYSPRSLPIHVEREDDAGTDWGAVDLNVGPRQDGAWSLEMSLDNHHLVTSFSVVIQNLWAVDANGVLWTAPGYGVPVPEGCLVPHELGSRDVLLSAERETTEVGYACIAGMPGDPVVVHFNLQFWNRTPSMGGENLGPEGPIYINP